MDYVVIMEELIFLSMSLRRTSLNPSLADYDQFIVAVQGVEA